MPAIFPENIGVRHLSAPTQAALSRSRSAVPFTKQFNGSGKRGQAGDTKENARNGVG